MANVDAQVAAMTAALPQVGAQFLAQLQAQQTAAAAAAAAPAPPAHTAVYNLHDSGQPVDLSSRSGAAAADKASAKLPIEITGKETEIVLWIQALKSHCSETYMEAAGPTGILDFGGKNLLTHYHSILMTDILQLFGLNGSMPTLGKGDRPTLFKAIIDTTAPASLLVSMQALTDLGILDPADFDFDIKRINAKASQLIALATTSARSLSDPECIQLLLTIYSRIKQPHAWFLWVQQKITDFEEGQMNAPAGGASLYPAFMQNAARKANQLNVDKSQSHAWKSTTLTEDVVAMTADAKKYFDAKNNKKEDNKPPAKKPGRNPTAPSSKLLPPFIKHFKKPESEGNAPYIVGDTKDFKGTTWHFCNCPTHRDKNK
ncbi:unnamed protein product [Cylindrotheca closterium]|uniref:Uncharacterized protein n=1 Tax=Cylindrotheca closterium TaxID=2856 RepID=A0AAD2FZK3_9STRA|nr:unnamed protein product [Cylindrotheca closterium]